MSSKKLLPQMFILVFVLLFLAGCGAAQVEPTTTPIPPVSSPLQPTPSLTSTTALLPQANELTPTPPEPNAGEVEVRIPFDIYSEAELPSTDVPECVNTIPFRMIRDQSRTMIEGEGLIDCHFEDKPQGSPITFHLILEYKGALNGELLPATSDKPSGWLDAYLALDGAIIQYYVGYPDEASNPCPESSPCRIPSTEVIPLPLAYEDGSMLTTPWIFTLHLLYIP